LHIAFTEMRFYWEEIRSGVWHFRLTASESGTSYYRGFTVPTKQLRFLLITSKQKIPPQPPRPTSRGPPPALQKSTKALHLGLGGRGGGGGPRGGPRGSRELESRMLGTNSGGKRRPLASPDQKNFFEV
jgi:hypothetical protein